MNLILFYLAFHFIKYIFIFILLLFLLFWIGQKCYKYYDPSIYFDMRAVWRIFYKNIKYAVIFPLLLLFSTMALLVPSWHQGSRVCVELPNGLLIGWNAFVDVPKILIFFDLPSTGGIHYPMSLKLPDGTILIRGDVESFYFTNSTVGGVHYPTIDKSFLGIRVGEHREKYHVAFVYRLDTGLVFRNENPKLYKKLIQEAGELISKNMGYHNQNLAFVFFDFRENPTYRRDNCPLDIFP